MAITGMFVFALVTDGITEASTTLRPLRPWTRSPESTTASGPGPMRQVEVGCQFSAAVSLKKARHCSSVGSASIGA